jgi:small multidrug resistance pump
MPHMLYIYLLIAICAETLATSALKTSESFTRLVPSLVVVAGYSTAFYLLSLCLKTMKIGYVYAIWSGLGIVLISLIGLIFFKQRIDVPGVMGIVLIIAGAVVLNVFSNIHIQ